MSSKVDMIGFIGLGVMGEAMCHNLITKGHWPVTAYDIDPQPLVRIAWAGGEAASSAGSVVDRADLVIMCLPGGEQVRALMLGPNGMIARVRAGQYVVDMSTSPPNLMQEMETATAERGAYFADAPIARTRQAAKNGTLAIMVGASADVFAVIRPILAVMGSDILHCGAPGAGQVVKIMNNMVLFQTVAALAEAISLAERAGVDAQVLLDTMSKGSGDSFALRNHAMKCLLPETYPDKAFSVKYAAKDLSYALQMAQKLAVHTPGAQHVAALFEQAIKAGDGDLYFPVIRKQLA